VTKAFQPTQGVSIAELRLKDNRRMQILQKPALPRNPELVRKIAPDAGNDLESYLIERLHSEIIEKKCPYFRTNPNQALKEYP
jgi:hypothetical protein